MTRYEVHTGVELPFWLALPNGAVTVRFEEVAHRVNVSNTVDRLDVGDFYLGNGNLGRVWVEREFGDLSRAQLQSSNPTMPITRHPSKTFLTHVRGVEAQDDAALLRLETESRAAWYAETLQIINRLIDVYTYATIDIPSQIGAVTSWDIGSVLISLWDPSNATPPRQLGGVQLYVRPETPAPPTIAADRRAEFETLLQAGVEIPAIQALHMGASALIIRQRYRSAIVDDVTALELEVESQVESRLTHLGLPAAIIEHLLRGSFDTSCTWLEALGGPALKKTSDWPKILEARRTRHRIVHEGATANASQAADVHGVVGDALKLLSNP